MLRMESLVYCTKKEELDWRSKNAGELKEISFSESKNSSFTFFRLTRERNKNYHDNDSLTCLEFPPELFQANKVSRRGSLWESYGRIEIARSWNAAGTRAYSRQQGRHYSRLWEETHEPIVSIGFSTCPD